MTEEEGVTVMEATQRIQEQECPIEGFLRQRAEIEQTIRERFQREITVMFTDIASSTQFYEVYGDIEGRSMIQRHNDLLVPIIEKHGGRLLRALGDGLMVSVACFALACLMTLKSSSQSPRKRMTRCASGRSRRLSGITSSIGSG